MSQKDSTVQDYLAEAGKASQKYFGIFKNKLTNTVVDTVYLAENLTKNVLPGNPVTREYDITSHVGSAGPGLLWKLYAGFKKSTKQEATVFVLIKKSLEVYPKKDRDLIIEAFKKGATQLARIKHPRILSLQHQLEESKDSLAFATEPCFCSVANALGNHENMPSELPVDFLNFKLFEVEIKYGLMQISEALAFLHKDVKILHRNICPESIVINANGAWKLAGFELFATNINDPNDPLKFPFKEWDGSACIVLNQPLEYLAPEYGLSDKCDLSSDMFSYGMFFYAVYNNGKTLYKCNENYSTFVNNVEELRKLTNSRFNLIPNDVREYLKMLLHINSELRPDASQVMKIPFFDDVAVKTLEYLDSSFQQDNLQKSIFFKGLPQIIDKLPQRVCLQRIIPCLEQEFINPDMIPFILPNIFLIADQSSNEEYVRHVLPRLKVIFKLQKPIQILLIVLRNMNMILSKTPPSDIKEHILPMVCRSLESDIIEIQELCLSTLPSFSSLIDTQSIKHQLLPRIRKLCWESANIGVRVNSLICIGKLLEHLEKWVVLDDVLPILERVNIRDSAVLMAMLGVYRIILTHPKLGITKDLLATRVLPHIIPISVDSNLNMKQFTAYMSLIKEMLAQIEVDQKKKLEQIEALEREKSIIPYAMANQSGSNKPKNIYKPPDTMMDQVMAGYGINNNMNGGLSTNQAPANFNPDIILNSGHSSTINHTKKELTLTQKHEMATRLENDFNLDANNTNSSISNSMSLNNLNNKSLTESLMDRNLADLSLSNNNNNNNNMHKPQLSIMPNSVSSNFTSQQNRFQTPNFGSSMNNHSFQPQNVGNQQMGFFGNLALAAPSDFGKSAFPTIAPPPTYNNMKQALNLNSFGNKMSSQNMNMNNNNNNNNNSNKKSALDDLADIFN